MKKKLQGEGSWIGTIDDVEGWKKKEMEAK